MKSPLYREISRMGPRFVANFDSTSGMMRALGNFLRGKDFPGTGVAPNAAEPLAAVVNKLPRKAKEGVYTFAGWNEAIPAKNLGKVKAEALSRWATKEYPKRKYPAVMVGSSSGAIVNLGAALGIPWLPQTFLIPVRQNGKIHPDEPKDGMQWGIDHAKPLLDANPELQLHHMHDANQDRLMLQYMTYFRVKRRTLGDAYESWMKAVLPEGGTILLSECQRPWPTTRISDRHVFQHGALGGATEEEFLHGSARVEEYLERYGSHVRRWDSPMPDGESPEAEWGFEEALRDDVMRFARENGYRVRRVVFKEPEHLSPLVADLYRWWNRERGIPANRLIVESFLMTEPYWTLRTGSVPFWMKFNMAPSLEWLNEYLDRSGPFDEIYLMLFSHGVNAVGLPPIEDWKEALRRARKHGDFLGVDEKTYPAHFIGLLRYHLDVKRKVNARYPIPQPLALDRFDAWLAEHGERYPVEWVDAERGDAVGRAVETRHA